MGSGWTVDPLSAGRRDLSTVAADMCLIRTSRARHLVAFPGLLECYHPNSGRLVCKPLPSQHEIAHLQEHCKTGPRIKLVT